MKENPIKLLLVDDHPIVRTGLHTVQELEPHVQIVGAAGTCAQAIECAVATRPDIVLMDVRLPDATGIDACRAIKAVLPQCRVLFLTSFAENELVLAAMEAGADGYLLKESDTRQIIDAIHAVLRGGAVFDPVVSRGVIRSWKSGETVDPLENLTYQERCVLAEVAKGKTDKEVGVALNLSAKTVRNYLDRVFQKLHVNTRTQAAMIYARFANSPSGIRA